MAMAGRFPWRAKIRGEALLRWADVLQWRANRAEARGDRANASHLWRRNTSVLNEAYECGCKVEEFANRHGLSGKR